MVKRSEPRLSSLSTPSTIKPFYKNDDEKKETRIEFTQLKNKKEKLKKRKEKKISTKLLLLLMCCD